MAALSDALEYQRRQTKLAEFIAHESAMAERLALPNSEPLTDDEWKLIEVFQTWCIQRRVRALPCRPEVLATWLGELKHRGPEYVASMAAALGRMHTAHAAIADPTASRAVRFVLDQIIKPSEPPRSWPKEEKQLFANLPPQIQAVIAKRETEREAGLRRKQNELAEELKKIKTQTSTEKETTMAKKSWNEVRGSFTSDKPELNRIKTPKDNAPGTDISKIVFEDTESTHNAGSGKLSNPGTRNK